MRCVRTDKSDKNSHRNIIKADVENMAATVSDRVNKKNDSSPQSGDHPVNSTPLRKMQNANAEESPDLDCYPSPIFPCTQEGGNEVAWDWHSSLNRTPENRSKKPSVQLETPKGTKLLQKKRNSNSPLLYKPLKRKTIKMENMESIGKFAAELQALDERVRFIKQTDRNSVENRPPVLANTNSKEDLAGTQVEKRDCVVEIGDCDNADKNDAGSKSYDDLFDDSIDDSMAKCTQEIEEQFNLITDIGNSSQTSIKREESPFSKLSDAASPIQSTSNENIIEPPDTNRNFLHKTISDGTLKTYSKLKSDANSVLMRAPVQMEKNSHRSHLSNNNIPRSHVARPRCDNAWLPKSNIAELFDFPDDSFDDCLATCVEDEKLLSTSKSNDTTRHRNDSTKYGGNCKQLIHAPLKSESKSASYLKTASREETSNSPFVETRKFFKTKSLSDQYIGQDASARNTSTASSGSSYARSKLHVNSSKSTTTITHRSTTRGSVSSNLIAEIRNDRKLEDSAISLMRDTGRTHGSDVNRCTVKEGADRFGRYNSTGNMRSDAKEATTSGSQPARCTAEEIEQKRLQAKMRLEAKKKLYSQANNNINR